MMDGRKQPAEDSATAPIQGNGPAWEGQPLRGEDSTAAVAACEGPADSHQQQHTIQERLPSGCHGSADPTGGGKFIAHGGSDVPTSSPPGAVDFLAKSSADKIKPGGSYALSGPQDDVVVTNTNDGGGGDDETAATSQSVGEGPPLVCGGVGLTHVRDIDLTINSGLITSEEKLPSHAHAGQDSDVDHFQKLLQAAIRQSDAERAQDRESARSFQRVQRPSPLERSNSPEVQPCTSTPCVEETTPSCDVSDRGNDDNIESIDSGLLSPAPSPAAEPSVVERNWVKYFSPEGYAYLYDEMTGDSEWVVTSEDENQSPDASGGAAFVEPGISADDEQDGQANRQGTATNETGGRGIKGHTAEGESVGTCEVSQWSQQTPGPDSR